jgi:hypothetical protein
LKIKLKKEKQMENLVEKMSELDSRIVHRGYTHQELREAFELIENKENWKNPISAVIDSMKFYLCDAAAEYFTGAGLKKVFQVSDSRVMISGPGYYLTIGA